MNDPDAELAWTRFRCFDADTGTWISTDPLGLRGSPQLYVFDGSPTEWVDPLGLVKGKRHPRNAQQQLRDIPTEGRTKAAIEKDLRAAGFKPSPARSEGTVWTKPMPKGQTAAVRLDPAEQRAQPRGQADELPHAHKEVVPTSNVDRCGNYDQRATTLNEGGNRSDDRRETHIPIAEEED